MIAMLFTIEIPRVRSCCQSNLDRFNGEVATLIGKGIVTCAIVSYSEMSSTCIFIV